MPDVATDFSVPEIGPDELIYVETVRQATRRLGYRAPAPDDLFDAFQALRDMSQFDVEVPIVSNRREVEVLKTGVKRLLAWYMRYLAVELNNFSAATTRFAEVLVRRGERLEKSGDELAARVGALEERVRRLETAQAGGAGAPASRRSPGSGARGGQQARRSSTTRKANGKQ